MENVEAACDDLFTLLREYASSGVHCTGMVRYEAPLHRHLFVADMATLATAYVLISALEASAEENGKVIRLANLDEALLPKGYAIKDEDLEAVSGRLISPGCVRWTLEYYRRCVQCETLPNCVMTILAADGFTVV